MLIRTFRRPPGGCLINTRKPASADRTARHQFQATSQPVSRTQASDAMTSRLPCHEAKCVQRRCFKCGSVPLHSDIKGTELPLTIYWYHSKGNWLRYNSAAESFYVMKLCSRHFILYCWNLYERRQIWVFDPNFAEVRGRRRTLVDGSLESSCRVLVNYHMSWD